MEFEFFNKIEFVEFLKSLPIKQRKKLISDIKLVETHDRLWSFQHEKMKLINRKEEISVRYVDLIEDTSIQPSPKMMDKIADALDYRVETKLIKA